MVENIEPFLLLFLASYTATFQSCGVSFFFPSFFVALDLSGRGFRREDDNFKGECAPGTFTGMGNVCALFVVNVVRENVADVQVNDPVHEVETDEANGEHHSGVLVDIGRADAK